MVDLLTLLCYNCHIILFWRVLDMEFYIIVIALLVAFVVFCISMAIKTSKIQKSLKAYKATHITGKHQAGLPIAEGTICAIGVEDDRFVISGAGSEFNLNYNKITSIIVNSDVEIQKRYVSSAGGAVAGALMFGAVGAIIGGRTKEKKSVKFEFFMIITYIKDDGDIGYVGFDVTDDVNNAQKKVKSLIEDNKISNTTNIINL